MTFFFFLNDSFEFRMFLNEKSFEWLKFQIIRMFKTFEWLKFQIIQMAFEWFTIWMIKWKNHSWMIYHLNDWIWKSFKRSLKAKSFEGTEKKIIQSALHCIHPTCGNLPLISVIQPQISVNFLKFFQPFLASNY